jgi:GPH family glycoside/pentoside/hexuronide:cation symporter/glucuronide carrier protein
MNKQNSENRIVISSKEKLFFFIVNFGNIPIMTLISGFLLIFYTDVIFLDPGIIAFIFLITRVIDAFNDPIMGYLVDHLPKTKWGRFRLYIVLGSILCSINYLVLWLAPAYAPEGKYLIVFISYILIGITFDLMDIPLNSMIPVMSETGKTRNSLALTKSLGYTFGGLTFYLITIPIINSFPTPLMGYTVLLIFTSLFVVIASFIGTLGIRERIEPIKKEGYNVKEFFKVIAARPVFIHFLSKLADSIGGGTAIVANIYFLTYIVGDPGVLGLFVIIGLFGNFIGFFIGKPFLSKYGKKYTLVIGSFISNIPGFFLLLDPSNVGFLLIISAFSSLGGGFGIIVGHGLQADNTDYVEWKQGYRAEAAIASLVSFVTKAGLGIGSAIVGFVLAITNYIPVTPPSSAIQGIIWTYVLIPKILGLLGGILILLFYPLTKTKNLEIVMALQERR